MKFLYAFSLVAQRPQGESLATSHTVATHAIGMGDDPEAIGRGLCHATFPYVYGWKNHSVVYTPIGPTTRYRVSKRDALISTSGGWSGMRHEKRTR